MTTARKTYCRTLRIVAWSVVVYALVLSGVTASLPPNTSLLEYLLW